ncbi:MAG: hypothetical protein JO111_15710 [Caulobacteraceae bacterium]|nr:hypothetical protein [Caulobacteraceae bacterium]
MKPGLFRRLILPGFAFKACVIGGGYATGRELAAFFLPSGPWGGLLGMAVAAVVWSAVCSLTFIFALQTGSRDYRTFFKHLLGPAGPLFEISYVSAMVVILAVFAAAAGAIFAGLTGAPTVVGSLLLMGAITFVVTFGNDSVERVFGYVSVFLYATYAIFFVLALTHFGRQASAAFASAVPAKGWVVGGVTYAGYNVIGAIAILPVLRHMRRRRDALVAGLLAGPLAMLPAVLFFVAMVAFYPAIQNQLLPSDYILSQLGLPAFRVLFQLMILAALLESGSGFVNAINERISAIQVRRRGVPLPRLGRLCVTLAVLTFSVFVATRFGLVQLIANGYRWLSYAILAIYVLPLVTIGAWRLWRARGTGLAVDPLVGAATEA